LEQDQFSQEFQAIGSALDGALEYVAGLYYYEENATESKINDFGVPGFPFLEGYQVDAEAKSTAIYGQATWTPDILDQRLGFTLGLRHTMDERKATKTFVETAISGPLAPVSGDVDYDNTSGQFVIDYAFNDDVNGYLKYATGYRSGGFNADGRPGNFEQGFDPETVKSTELGLKSAFWDQRVTLNFAAYYNEYTDMQVDAFEPPAFSRTDNAGEATIQGAELEWKILLAEGLTIDGFYSYMDTDIKEWIVPGLGDVSGQRKMPNAPENQAKLGVEYAFQPASFGQVTARVDYMWQDESWSNPDLVNRNDAYGLWNARLQLSEVSLPKGDLRIALWGKNLADEEYTIITTDFSGFGEAVSAMYGQPRTYGVDFIYEF
jgi:iron complex outermembrane receptor protein